MIRTHALLSSLTLVCLVSCSKEPAPAPPQTKAPAPSAPTAPSTPPPNPLAPARPGDLSVAGTPPDASATQIQAQGLTFVIPASWVQQDVANSMRAAQYQVPAPAGSGLADGEFVVFRGIGGSPADNLTRWQKQMTDLTIAPLTATRTNNGITIDSLVQFGTYNAGTAMSDAGPQPNWGFAGAIISGGPQGPIYLRLTGPRAVVDGQLPQWGELLKSIIDGNAGGAR